MPEGDAITMLVEEVSERLDALLEESDERSLSESRAIHEFTEHVLAGMETALTEYVRRVDEIERSFAPGDGKMLSRLQALRAFVAQLTIQKERVLNFKPGGVPTLH